MESYTSTETLNKEQVVGEHRRPSMPVPVQRPHYLGPGRSTGRRAPGRRAPGITTGAHREGCGRPRGCRAPQEPFGCESGCGPGRLTVGLGSGGLAGASLDTVHAALLPRGTGLSTRLKPATTGPLLSLPSWWMGRMQATLRTKVPGQL